MPENPLLPNAKLRQLYTAMLHARSLSTGRSAGMEAVLASVAQQLEPGDAVLPFTHASTLGALLQPARFQTAKRGASAAAVLAPTSSPLAFAAGVAAGAQLAGAERLVVALLDTRKPEPNWSALLEHAHRDRLPLIVICPESPEQPALPAGAAALTWATLSRVAKKLSFPVLTVDGADAVAMYRAMQESILRARHGDGPALLWCLMSDSRPGSKRAPDLSPPLSPVARLRNYLVSRHIALPRTPAKPVSPARRNSAARP